MMSECKVRNCGYWYQDEYEERPSCHYTDRRFPAPCEEPEDDYADEAWDDEPDDIDSDEGFDPYEGCFTFDC